MDRLLFEIVAETEIAEHFKEGVVKSGASDVVDVAGAETLLARRRLCEFEFASSEEVILELVHTSGA